MKRMATAFLHLLLERKRQEEVSGEQRLLGSAENSYSTTLSADAAQRRRRQVIDRIRKGRKLRSMVSKAGFGILMHRRIW